MKLLLAQLPPLFARGTAGVAAALLVAAAALALGHGLGVPRAERGRPRAAASFLNVFAWMGLSTLSLRWLDVGQAALLVYTMPVWATLLAWPVLGERPTARSAAACCCAWAGCGCCSPGRRCRSTPAGSPASALALGAALLFACATVALRPAAGVAPLALVAWQLVLGCLPMVVLGLLFEQPAAGARRRPRLGADGLHDAGADGAVLPDLVRRAQAAAAGDGLGGDAADAGDRRRARPRSRSASRSARGRRRRWR